MTTSATTLNFRPVDPSGTEDVAWIFYSEDASGKMFRHVFHDSQGRQMAFSQRDFADIAPHIHAANEAMIHHGHGIDANLIYNAHITYNIAAGTFDFVTPNPDFSGTCRAAVRPHIEAINAIASRMKYFVAEEDPLNHNPPPKKTTRPLLERLSENTKLHVSDFDKFVNAVKSPDAPIAHQLVNLSNENSYKDIDWSALKKNKDFVFVTIAHKGHASTLVFDRRRNRAYYYDPAGKSIEHPKRKSVLKVYDYLAMSYRLNSERIISNNRNHQVGENVHCGRHVLMFYNNILQELDLTQAQFREFCVAHPDVSEIKDALHRGYEAATI